MEYPSFHPGMSSVTKLLRLPSAIRTSVCGQSMGCPQTFRPRLKLELWQVTQFSRVEQHNTAAQLLSSPRDDETTSKQVFLKCLPNMEHCQGMSCLDEWMSVSLEYTFTKLYNCSPCDSVRIVSLEINKACFRDRFLPGQ